MALIPDTSKRFKDFRKKEGITQVMLAKEVSLSQSIISKYDNGDVEVPLSIITYLHERHKMSYEWFFHGTGKRRLNEDTKPTLVTDIKAMQLNINLLIEKMAKLERDIRLVASKL